MQMTKDVLTTATAELLGGDDLTTMTSDRLLHLITLTQHGTDLLLNEIERRGELTFVPYPLGEWQEGLAPVVPYMSDYFVETILTRNQDGPATIFPPDRPSD